MESHCLYLQPYSVHAMQVIAMLHSYIVRMASKAYQHNYNELWLGQTKLIASFPFQDFQNMTWAGGHYSLFIIAKNV